MPPELSCSDLGEVFQTFLGLSMGVHLSVRVHNTLGFVGLVPPNESRERARCMFPESEGFAGQGENGDVRLIF